MTYKYVDYKVASFNLVQLYKSTHSSRVNIIKRIIKKGGTIMPITRNLIEYHGIDTCKYGDMPYFKQINVDYTFCVPSQKPDIEQVVRVWATPCIRRKKL